MSIVNLLAAGLVRGAMGRVLPLLLRWNVLASLGCAVGSDHLALVVVLRSSCIAGPHRVATTVVLVRSATWAVVRARSHRDVVIGAVGPTVESWALRRWRGYFGGRVIALAGLHVGCLISLLRDFAALSLAWGGGRRSRRVLLLIHIWVREASSHCLCLLEPHLLMLLRLEVIVGEEWPRWSTPIHTLRLVLCRSPRRPLALIDLLLELVLHNSLCLPTLLRVLPVAVLPVIFINQIALIRNEADDHVGVAELSDLVQPIAQVYEGLHVANVVDQERANGEPVVRGRDAQELLGSRGVPDLGSHRLIAVGQGDVPEHVLDTVGPLWLGFIDVLTDSEEEVGLAYAFVADDDDLVEIIKRLSRIIDGVREMGSRVAQVRCIRVRSNT